MHRGEPAYDYTKVYQLEKVRSWLDRGGDINATSFSKQGHTLLMMGCIENNAKLVAELCQRGADVNLKAGGKTALMHASVWGQPECAQLLLDAGADVRLRADVDDSDYTENDGLTALEMVEREIERNGMRPRHRRVLNMLSDRC